MALKPTIGARTTWLKQSYNLKFEAGNFSEGIFQTPGDIARKIGVRMKNDLWGIGGKVGLDTTWHLGKGFCLFGTGAFSVLEGWYKVRYRLSDQKPVEEVLGIFPGPPPSIDSTIPYTGTAQFSRRLHTIFTMADLGLEICWQKSFSDNGPCLSIKLGYDQSIYFGTNQFMNPQYDFTLISFEVSTPTGGEESGGPNFFNRWWKYNSQWSYRQYQPNFLSHLETNVIGAHIDRHEPFLYAEFV